MNVPPNLPLLRSSAATGPGKALVFGAGLAIRSELAEGGARRRLAMRWAEKSIALTEETIP